MPQNYVSSRAKVKTVLFHAREAGVASMIAALENPFLDAGFKLLYDVADDAANILKGGTPGTFADADIVICGYDDSCLDRTGDFLTELDGRKPTLGLLDSWKGVDRFWTSDGRLRQLTNRLIVPDKEVRAYLLARGLPSDWPIVAEHPGLERMRGLLESERARLRKEAFRLLGISEYPPVLLVFSEPFRLPNGNRLSLLDAKVGNGKCVQTWLSDKYAMDYNLAVRFHPIENHDVPLGWLDTGHLDLDLALSLADRVIGLGSTTLAYAVAYGLNVQCLDKHIVDWVPELSDIPSELWRGLVASGIFQNDPERLDTDYTSNIKEGFKRIIEEAEKMIVPDYRGS